MSKQISHAPSSVKTCWASCCQVAGTLSISRTRWAKADSALRNSGVNVYSIVFAKQSSAEQCRAQRAVSVGAIGLQNSSRLYVLSSAQTETESW